MKRHDKYPLNNARSLIFLYEPVFVKVLKITGAGRERIEEFI